MAKLLVLFLLLLAAPAFGGSVSDAMDENAPTDFPGGILTLIMCVAGIGLWTKEKIESWIYDWRHDREIKRNRLYHAEQQKLRQEAKAEADKWYF